MKNLKKRVTTLLLAGIMMTASIVSVYAGSESHYTSVNSAIIKYEAGCSAGMGEALTWVSDKGQSNYSYLYADVTLYVLNNSTGAVSEYDSASSNDSEYCSAEVFITTSGYEGYYVNTNHTARVIRSDNSDQEDSYSFNDVYK